MMRRILRNILLLLLLGNIFAATPLFAQFIHFNMNVESELSTDVMQELDFGTAIVNSGRHRVAAGSPQMGIFQIRALNNQRLLVTLHRPEFLVHTDPNIKERIPIRLEASYSNSGEQDIRASRPFNGNTAVFTIDNEDTGSQSAGWETAYVFVYGTLTIGRIPEGEYSGLLMLSVEYQ